MPGASDQLRLAEERVGQTFGGLRPPGEVVEAQAEKDDPQPHVPLTFGLLNLNPSR
jgi:hypothetical protein